MVKNKKERGFMDIIKGVFIYLSSIVSASIFPKIEEDAEKVMKNIDDRLLLMEKRLLRKIFSFLIIGLGGIFLIFALFFLLIEFLGWSKSLAFFSIGILIFIIGLILKIKEQPNR